MTKCQEALIHSLYTRHGRKKHDMCICEGVRCCRELFLLRPDLVFMAICTDDFKNDDTFNLEFIKIPAHNFQSFSSTVTSQGVLCVAKRPVTDYKQFSQPESPFIVVLDRISDPGNLGTIIRTVRAVGLNELWYTSGTVDPFNDKVIRSATASQFALNMREFPDLSMLEIELRKFGYEKVYRTDPHGSCNLFEVEDLFNKTAIVFGNEGAGAGELHNSIPITIPMPGKTESINVAQAATVVLFESVRRRSAVLA